MTLFPQRVLVYKIFSPTIPPFQLNYTFHFFTLRFFVVLDNKHYAFVLCPSMVSGVYGRNFLALRIISVSCPDRECRIGKGTTILACILSVASALALFGNLYNIANFSAPL